MIARGAPSGDFVEAPGVGVGSVSLSRRVHEYLDRDAPAREVLSRGALNLRSMARWMMRTRGWSDATEEGIVSALRRYPTGPRTRSASLAASILSRSYVNTRANICSFVLVKTPHAHGALNALVECLDITSGEMMRIIEGDRAIKVIVDGNRLEAAMKAVAPERVNDLQTHLVEFGIVFPNEAQQAPGILAAVYSSLAVHDVNIVETLSGSNEQLLFVQEQDALRAFHVLQALTRGD